MAAETTDLDDLRVRAERWLADDPDPADRDELRAVLDGLPGTATDLADRFAGPLTFGTAGLRGPLRAGPNGMNLAVVTQAAAGLVRWLAAQGGEGPLVIGYDARRGSLAFAERTAQVATGAGRPALLLPRPLPTPVLAFAVRQLGAVAGVMVTASHNPPQDNGYKVYLGAQLGGELGAGAQIVPPADAGIEAAIRAVGPLAEVPLGPVGQVLGDDLVAAYVERAAAVVDPTGPRDLKVAYTPLHGVGGAVLTAAFAHAGFGVPGVVPEQAEPDPAFPTVSFPNPEEPGAVDLLVALADRTGADLAIANDPDADRCAVAVRDAGSWRMLRGDEVGALLADHLMRRGVTGLYATTIVSSALLRAMTAARGLPYDETLTGFKWIVRAGGGREPLVYGYEEALGYCVAPEHVRDKDGITAALTVAELAAGLKAEGRTLLDRLDELAAEFGVHHTEQLSVRVEDLRVIADSMARIRAATPTALLGQPVTEATDLLPDADVVILRTGAARVVIRPSGTEPKLKAYLEVVEPVTGGDVPAARQRARAAVTELRNEIAAALGL
ncbi:MULTISPECIES: phospho-sugar mutase [Micromonospora]|uniref:phospho-sugar mutase n=1 Tax=Micromonospora TaxID=1873 RepID=UPI0003EED557|nr:MULTISPECIES: phospho-sugar mutase [Micromonospora]EWM66016.1 phosphomannomutase [Micromonospora sp. M42]MBC8989192.1 phospho-sugar mutase [Micromonospora chalcea]MCK1807606.1 phospho-sugar mutase [Micromonospora sp. R42106]MCK1832271.1 phospho-sugar mutase [Micromonospora sp. R42003]MCK1843630.1 phospho-sugar mutase [Micromonospora sp. R42004]